MKKKNIFRVVMCSVLMLNIFTACCNKPKLNKIQVNKVTSDLNTEEIWNEKVRFLCETDCKDFDNPSELKKDYILKVCQYYKTLSDANIEYNDDIKKYIISEIEVKDIVRNLFGIDNFTYEDNDVYNEKLGIYMFDDYVGFFDDGTYKNKQVNKLDDQRIEFTVTVQNSTTGLKHNEKYILKKGENQSYYYIVAKNSKS